uniref:Beta'-coat protein n=1 Tax=Oncorhynchus kisutch TaxID=8019 RepID=A0A8C7GWT4_ONCKI
LSEFCNILTFSTLSPFTFSCPSLWYFQDDMQIRMFNYTTLERAHMFDAHSDYIRCIAVHPTQPYQQRYDMLIKLQVFEGHTHYVMHIVINPKDNNQLSSASLDRTIKVWQLGSSTPNFTLEGHEKGVNCIDYYTGGDKPYLVSGADDRLVTIWDYQVHSLYTPEWRIGLRHCISVQEVSLQSLVRIQAVSHPAVIGSPIGWPTQSSSNLLLTATQSSSNLLPTATQSSSNLLPTATLPSCKLFPIVTQPSCNFLPTATQPFSNLLPTETNPPVISSPQHPKLPLTPSLQRPNPPVISSPQHPKLPLTPSLQRPNPPVISSPQELVCIATVESFFMLHYLAEKVATAQETKEGVTEDGIKDSFEVLCEIQEVVKTGLWVGDCFIYTSYVNKLNYYVGGEIVTIAHLDRTMYLLGYIPKDDRLYLGDKELNIFTYSLLVSVLEYQTAVMRRDFGMADRVLPTIPKEMRTRVTHFLEKQGFRRKALAVSTDSEHRFELALHLGELKITYQLAVKAESEQKWKQLAELATTKCQFVLAQECLHHAQDHGGLLLLATASGNANGKTNVAFLTYFLQGKLDNCLELLIKTNRLPEAAFLARTYLPSHVSRVVKLWKESLGKVNQKEADALANPTYYSNLFPGLQEAFLAEDYPRQVEARRRVPSHHRE